MFQHAHGTNETATINYQVDVLRNEKFGIFHEGLKTPGHLDATEVELKTLKTNNNNNNNNSNQHNS